ncbi:Protein YIPF5 [Hondaea fermentalgiana]|uniref:Protein YIPF n=1 Tax=Hondaea fermentalgiana TaxID=2315210 RepID=A0A2R5GPW4_9STRA|nr:Protein YIPF5 [Hondaea fermentalgiana]|eukprot:GBG30663.1 Protein YIPF5 [Hondaea fermentalgiana]
MYGNNNNNNSNSNHGGGYGHYSQQSPYSQGGFGQPGYDQGQQQQPPSQQQYGGNSYDNNNNHNHNSYDYGSHQQQQDSWQSQPQTFSHVQVPAGAAPSEDEWFSTAASSAPPPGGSGSGSMPHGSSGNSAFGGQAYTSTGFNMSSSSGSASGPPPPSSVTGTSGFGGSSSSSSSSSKGFGAASAADGSSAMPQYTSHGFGAPPPEPEVVPGGPVNYEDEPPLLEELGINFDHIRTKTIAVIVPTKTIEPEILADADMAGPLVFALVQGFCLMLSGKLFFGYVFGFGVMGCLFIYVVINLMNHAGNTVIDIYRVCSVLGYCLLPIVLLSAVTILFDLREASTIGTPLTLIAILWCTQTATRFFEAATQMSEQRFLIAYPVFLLYACFALITVF